MDSESHPGDRFSARRRFRRRLSVRGLMIVVLLIGSALGWYVLEVRDQREAVAAIRSAGGEVGYDWQAAPSANPADLVKSTRDLPRVFGSQAVWARWLVRLLGGDVFGRVDKVWFTRGRGEISEPLLAQIGRLHNLEVVSVQNRIRLDTAGLVHLKGLSRLRDVRLNVKARGPSTDLSWLRGKSRLETLILGDIPVRDEDLIHLRPLTNLRCLAFRSPHITDAGLVHLSGLTRLECLVFHHASIRGEGLAHLDRMGSLDALAILRSKTETLDHLPRLPIRQLVLPFTRIDDRGLARLRSMPALEEVYLDGTRISDAGLERLAIQPKIDSVHAEGTGVTSSGVQAFRAKRPRVVVTCGPVQKSPYFSIP